MRALLAMLLAAMLGGCLHEPESAKLVEVAQATPAAPPPKMVYSKPGGTNEEFRRTRAHCLVQAELGPPESWVVIYTSCLRAEGWVRVPQNR